MSEDPREFYRRYLERCNEHRFSELGDFVTDPVEVNGEPMSAARYGEGLAEVVEVVPDFHWDLRQLLVDGDRLAALLIDTGTGPGGRTLQFHELAVYRVADGRIAEVWGDLDAARLTG